MTQTIEPQATGRHRVVIIGGGFGGLEAARGLRRADVDVTLIDRRNFHLFQPLLYQVATGTLSPADIASPLRHVLGKYKNIKVLLGEVLGFDLGRRRVLLQGDPGEGVPYDSLIVAAGVSHNYFGHDEWAELAPGLKTVEDATRIRRRIFNAFEAAEREPQAWQRHLTFVIVGGGATGVELAGALAEISKNTLSGEFHHIDPAKARIVLVENSERVLGGFAPNLSTEVQRELAKLGVELRLGWRVTGVTEAGVTLHSASDAATEEHIATSTVLWAAGVQASPLGRALAASSGAQVDRAGRVMVEPDCTLPGHKEVFVIGDLSHMPDPRKAGALLPGVAQTALQQGRFAARCIRLRLQGQGGNSGPFVYRDLGNMATVGRGVAIMERGKLRVAGVLVWLAWIFIHIMNLVEFENRLLVFMQWAWSFFTWNRSARLITGESHPPKAP